MKEEGWYTDPYRLHEKRWFSDGSPTKLVSDGGIEATDPPPNTPFIEPPEPVADSGPVGDSQERDSKLDEPGVKGAWEAFVETGGD
jgi:hypothetical protein